MISCNDSMSSWWPTWMWLHVSLRDSRLLLWFPLSPWCCSTGLHLLSADLDDEFRQRSCLRRRNFRSSRDKRWWSAGILCSPGLILFLWSLRGGSLLSGKTLIKSLSVYKLMDSLTFTFRLPQVLACWTTNSSDEQQRQEENPFRFHAGQTSYTNFKEGHFAPGWDLSFFLNFSLNVERRLSFIFGVSRF